MIVGQRPGASPKVLIVILALLAVAWIAREALHHGAPTAKSPDVRTGAAQPASISVERPLDSQTADPATAPPR